MYCEIKPIALYTNSKHSRPVSDVSWACVCVCVCVCVRVCVCWYVPDVSAVLTQTRTRTHTNRRWKWLVWGCSVHVLFLGRRLIAPSMCPPWGIRRLGPGPSQLIALSIGALAEAVQSVLAQRLCNADQSSVGSEWPSRAGTSPLSSPPLPPPLSSSSSCEPRHS